MIENIEPNNKSQKEFPTNYHWLINEIFCILRNWIDKLNETGKFIHKSSYAEYISDNYKYCLTELYKGEKAGKVDLAFISSNIYFGILSVYFSPMLNAKIKGYIEVNVLSKIPIEYAKPVFSFALNEEFAIRFDEFLSGKFHVNNSSETKIISGLRKVLMENKLITA